MPVNSSYIELAAPAKINLSLRVLRRREDGFHEIKTRMVPVPGVSDQVRVSLRETQSPGKVELSCEVPGVPTDETNLAVRAVRELEASVGRPFPALRIELIKNIPSGAGLGGGSSDAASVLLAVNQLTGLGYSKEELAEVASRVGSDVPFFIYGGACDCTGRGEFVSPLPPEDQVTLPPVLLIKPPFGVETPGSYKRWQESKEIPGVHYAPQSSQAGELVNDLERPVFEKFPFLAELKMWLLERPEVNCALMSGSGATVFAFVKDVGQMSALQSDVRQHFGENVWIGYS